MSYTSISEFIYDPLRFYVDDQMNPSNYSTKGAYLGLAALSFVTAIPDTIISAGAGIATALTLGKSLTSYDIYRSFKGSSILEEPYLNLMKIVNVDVKYGYNELHPPLIPASGKGFISNSVIAPLSKLAESCGQSDNFLKRHVASRLTYVALAVSCIFSRVADAIIGVPAGLLSLVTLGNFKSLNNVAYRSLQATDLIDDLTFCFIKLFNPWIKNKKF